MIPPVSLKYRLLFFLIVCFSGVKGQVISGRVIADTTNQPVVATINNTSGHQTSSDVNGNFSITTAGRGDTIKVSAMGYKTYFYPVSQWKHGNITIRLQPVSLMLKDVTVKANRDHKKDSIRNRKEFASVFDYKPPKVTDAFVHPPTDVPFAFVSIDLGVIFRALTSKNDPTNKLKRILLRDEQADYIATRYNRGLVTRITQLKGDSLDKFMDRYYPTIDWVKKTSDYDMIQFIKTKAVEFRKTPN